jgi:hypothetical protein
MALLLGRREGLADLGRSVAVAAEEGLEDHVGRAYIHLGWAASRSRDFTLMERLGDGIDYCTEHGLELWRLYLIAYRGRAELDRGRWSDAAESASFVLTEPNQTGLLKLLALTLLGTVRARRGDPDVWPLLDEAAEIAAGKHDLQHLGPVAIARTETASPAGDRDLAAGASDATLALAVERGASWIVGELALWRRRAGIDEPPPAAAAEPFAAHLAGDPDPRPRRGGDSAVRTSLTSRSEKPTSPGRFGARSPSCRSSAAHRPLPPWRAGSATAGNAASPAGRGRPRARTRPA